MPENKKRTSDLSDERLTAAERAALLNGRKVPGEAERQRIARVAAEIVAARGAFSLARTRKDNADDQ